MNKNILLHAVAAIAAIACVFSSCTRQGNISVAASDPDILYMGRIHWSDSLTADFNYPGVTAMLNFNGTGLAMTAKPGSGQFMVEIDHGDAFKINLLQMWVWGWVATTTQHAFSFPREQEPGPSETSKH